MLLDLLNQDYPSRSLDQNQSQLTNMFLEADKSKGEYKVIALPTPGLTSFCNTTQASVRAIFEHNEVLYAVAGSKFYSVDSVGAKTELGTLNTSSGFAKIVALTGGNDSNNQLVIIDGTNGYHYNVGTSTATFPISDVDFPQTASDLTAQDDYAIAEKNNSISFFISNTADGTAWEALDFASKTGFADRLVAIESLQRKLWLLGSKTTEIWYNSGNADFTFERISDTFIHHGCAAKRSVVIANEELYFLAKTKNGGYNIIKLGANYTPTPISTQPYDYLIGTFSTVSDCIGYAYKKSGHEFVGFTFPTAETTIEYDLTSGAWNRRSSNVSGSYTRFLGQTTAFCYGKHLVGDFNSGIIYYQDDSSYTENGTAIQRVFVSPPIIFEDKLVTIPRLQIDVETGIGSSKTLQVYKSFDNGNNWILHDTLTVPSKGSRLFTTRIGSSRTGILIKLVTTMNAKFILRGFKAELQIGHN